MLHNNKYSKAILLGSGSVQSEFLELQVIAYVVDFKVSYCSIPPNRNYEDKVQFCGFIEFSEF